MRKGLTAALLAAAMLLALPGCSRAERQTRTWYTWFDTVTTLVGYGTPKEFEDACAVVEDTLERYHRQCDIYHEYSGVVSAMTLNRAAGTEPLAVEPELMAVLAFGKEMFDRTGGACHIAMGSVLSLWHDRREAALNGGEARLPDDGALRAAADHCDIRDLALDEAAGTALLLDPDMSVDLGAVAKGYAAEAAAKALADRGFTGYALSVGGNVRVLGAKPDGGDWTAGIQDPDSQSENAYILRVRLRDRALVTSGSYQRYYEVDGVRYHHIISPETLYPKNDFLSVTVLCPDSGTADALSTALFNMDLEVGMDYVNQMPDAEVCWVLADGEIVYSPGFEAYILP